MREPEIAVRLRGVTKRFGPLTAVDRFDLEVPRGSLYGLLGPNGSGKTTSIRMIMGILRPDEGEIRLFGGDPEQTRRRRVGYLPEERGLYRKMKVLELLTFLAEIRGVPRRQGRERAGAWLERLGLAETVEKRAEDLSKGMQQKVQFIATVLHEPDLLILDEPFSGLDPINQDVLEDIVREFHARGTTILFSTHLMDQAERLCHRVCLIARAQKVLDGDLRALKEAERKGVLALVFDGPEDWMTGADVLSHERVGEAFHLLLRDDADPQDILRRGMEAGARIRRFEMVEPRLHEIFVRHAGEAGAAAAGVPTGVPAGGGAGGGAA